MFQTFEGLWCGCSIHTPNADHWHYWHCNCCIFYLWIFCQTLCLSQQGIYQGNIIVNYEWSPILDSVFLCNYERNWFHLPDSLLHLDAVRRPWGCGNSWKGRKNYQISQNSSHIPSVQNVQAFCWFAISSLHSPTSIQRVGIIVAHCRYGDTKSPFL